MPDEHPDGPAYDWLFTGQAGRTPRPSEDADATQAMAAGDRQDPDATQAMPAGTPLDPDATRATAAGDPLDPDATRAIGPTGTTGNSSARDAASTRGSSVRPGEDRRSFGGTYTGPGQPAAREPRFATPVQSRPARSRPAQPPAARPPSGIRTRSVQPSPAGPAPGATASTRPPRRRRNWWVRGVLALLLAWLIFLVAVPIWAWSTISKVNAVPGGHRPPDTAGTTYLLVGSDSRAGLTKAQRGALGTGTAAGQRTDTVILLDVPVSGPTLLLSIPRDSFVDIPGHGENKINAAYSIGGPRLLVHTVEKATKVRIDNYVEIGFAGFVDVVDAVGGIEVCPKTSINDPKAGHLRLHKGCQHIDGRTALGYSRSRAFPNGDITRALHQREVIGAVGHAAASWQSIVLPWRYVRLNSAAAKTVQVGKDVGPIDLMRFAWAMAHVGSGSTKRCVVPYANLGAVTSAGSAVLWDQQRAHALFAAIRSGDTSSVHCSPQ
jgi:LCP family protein required for cell wall assembly